MSVKLPDSIAGLHQALLDGQWSFADACSYQTTRFDRLAPITQAVSARLPAVPTKFDAAKPLSGAVLAHKDIFDLTGRHPGMGRDRGGVDRARVNAPVLQSLEDAGALNLGTLVMAEDACAAVAQTAHLPTPVNPLGEQLAVGGSSSGSAVAVASGMVFASLGTDTAGSVRIPAMTCGVMGLKTTHGLIDRQGMQLLCPTLDSIGVLSRSIDDMSRIMRVLTPQLPWQREVASQTLSTGFWLEGATLDESVSAVVAPMMRARGQHALNLARHEQRASALQHLIMAYEVGQTHQARIASGQACQQVTSLGTVGLSIPRAWWLSALRLREQYLREFIEDAFARADVLLLPLQVAPLPTVQEVYQGNPGFEVAKLLALHRYCGWLNYLGLPALAIPVGHDQSGLPVSIQLVAKPFHEPQLLALGQDIQNEIYGKQGIMPVLRIKGWTS
jgi:aspartyl-tRNA(Asn)/glutamyl-tRNA(Gln) amidotransferase subunit A